MDLLLLTATIRDIIVQTIQTLMPICVSYLTTTMPIAYLCSYFNFCQCKCCLQFL